MGYTSVATESLSEQLAKWETDAHPAGYYTSGFLVAAPQLADVAEYAQTVSPAASRRSTSYTLILAYGRSGAAAANSGPSPLASKLWTLQNQLFFRDVVAYKSAFGEQASGNRRTGVEYNRITRPSRSSATFWASRLKTSCRWCVFSSLS